MPSSQNRRRIEIPADLFEQLSERANAERTTIAALAARLLREGLERPSQTDDAWQRDAFGALQRQLTVISDRLDALHHVAPIPPRSAILRNPRPLASTTDLMRQARRELIDEMRRERDRGREDQPEGDET